MPDLEVVSSQIPEDFDFMKLARERYTRGVDADRENREDALDDLRFRAGDQWPEGVKQERDSEDRPCLTINKMGASIRQVTGDVRLNRPAIKVRPVDGASDKDLAKVFTGLIRNIEQTSDAQAAYVTSLENSAAGGTGSFRIVTEFADDDTFDQDIRIRRMTNPFSVVWDPDAEQLTKEDANWCFVVEDMGLEEFKTRYPDASVAEFQSDEPSDFLTDWWRDEKVRVAEYWRKVPVNKTLGLSDTGETFDLTEIPEEARAELGIVKTREVESHRIEQVVLSGVEIHEGPCEWAGRYIPIIPVWGEEVHVGGHTVRHGIVRFAKDPQRMYNYHRSAAVEMISLAPKAPYIATVEQIAGLEKYWDTANTANWSVLPYKSDPKAGGPPQRSPPPPVQQALNQEAAIASDDIKAVTGLFDASLGARSNETSGKAILARQREGDVGTFVYIDNLGRAIGYAGRILVDLIPKIYDSTRIVRILGEDESEDFVEINKMTSEGLVNDLSVGKYDVVVTTGPSFTTKREEMSESMLSFVQAVPQAGLAAADLIAKAQDWAGAEEIANRLRKMAVQAGLAEPQEGDPPPQPSPEQIAAAEKAKQEALKAAAELEKAAMEVEKTNAEVEGKELDNATKAFELAVQSGQLVPLIAQEVARVLRDTTG